VFLGRRIFRLRLPIAVPFGYIWHREAGLGLDPDLRLRVEIHGSVLPRQHDRDDAFSDGWIGRVRGVVRQGPVEIIDFEHDVLTVDFEAAEVVLLVGIVGVTKVVEHRNRLDETLNSFLAESGNTGGDDGVAANQMLPEFVIEGADAVGLGRHCGSPVWVEKIAADLGSSRRDEGVGCKGICGGSVAELRLGAGSRRPVLLDITGAELVCRGAEGDEAVCYGSAQSVGADASP
jgi:hypothetical protein